jgi:hypothetical protein
MAYEIQADYASGSVLYAIIRSPAGQVWHPAGGTFEDWGSGGHTTGDYDIVLADKSGSRYVGSFDTDIPGGYYCIQVFRQAGANPAETDTLVCSREILWSGVGELTPAKILVNKAVQDKITGAIEYYDDDGQTILLTLMPYDDEEMIMRMPE